MKWWYVYNFVMCLSILVLVGVTGWWFLFPLFLGFVITTAYTGTRWIWNK